jgi:hypothetical protein
MMILCESVYHWLEIDIKHACMLAFTTFNVKLYPIEHVKGLKKRLGTKSSHDMDFQEDGIPFVFDIS